MPDFSGTLQASRTWRVAASPQHAISLAVRASGHEPDEQSGAGAVVSLGSRMGFRLLGFVTPARMMPVRMTVDAQSASNELALLTVRLSSYEGWYLVRLVGITERLYRRAFDRIFESIENAVTKPEAVES